MFRRFPVPAYPGLAVSVPVVETETLEYVPGLKAASRLSVTWTLLRISAPVFVTTMLKDTVPPLATVAEDVRSFETEIAGGKTVTLALFELLV